MSDPTVFDPNGYAMFCLCHGMYTPSPLLARVPCVQNTERECVVDQSSKRLAK